MRIDPLLNLTIIQIFVGLLRSLFHYPLHDASSTSSAEIFTYNSNVIFLHPGPTFHCN